MKRILAFFALLLAFISSAQQWEASYDGALLLAQETDRPLVLVFAGSDWCAPCIKLEKEIWQSEDFKEYASENYVLYRADFPRKKKNQLPEKQAKANGELSGKFNPNGHFPLVVLLDSNERILGTTSYKKLSSKEYITHLNSFLK